MEILSRLRVYKLTNTLDGLLDGCSFTSSKEEAEIILVGGKSINIEEFPLLKGIFKTGVGIDNLPMGKAEQLSIKIGLPSKETAQIIHEETADFACNMILQMLFKGKFDWNTWNKVTRKKTSNNRLLIIGMGKIGTIVHSKMQTFMDVDSFDILYHSKIELIQKIKNADVISLHVPLTEQTINLVDDTFLGNMKYGAAIINTSRGKVINEEALYLRLKKKQIFAALDVFWEEPYNGKLNEISSDQLIVTPHIASTCEEFLIETAKDFKNFLKGF